MDLAQRVAALYWELNKKTSCGDSSLAECPQGAEPADVDPSSAAQQLRDIADRIDNSSAPSLMLVTGSLARLARRIRQADANSLAKSIQERIWQELISLMPDGTWDFSVGRGSSGGLYDTSWSGKGWRDGYVSFGAKPAAWSNAALIGGILFRFRYQSEGVIPAKGTPEHSQWLQNRDLGFEGNVAENGVLSGGYYNHQPGGTVDTFSAGSSPSGSTGLPKLQDTWFGDAVFEVARDESVLSWNWSDPSGTRRSIQEVIDSIAAHPPVGAMSKNKQTLLKMNPYTSVRKFVNQLVKERRNQFYTDEAAMVAQAEGTVVNSVVESLKKKGFEYVVGKSPHLAKV
jgi:hypothetical protein